MSDIRFSTTKLPNNILILAVSQPYEVEAKGRHTSLFHFDKEDALRLIETLKNELERMA